MFQLRLLCMWKAELWDDSFSFSNSTNMGYQQLQKNTAAWWRKAYCCFAAAESCLFSPRVLYWLGKPLLLSQCNHSHSTCLLFSFSISIKPKPSTCHSTRSFSFHTCRFSLFSPVLTHAFSVSIHTQLHLFTLCPFNLQFKGAGTSKSNCFQFRKLQTWTDSAGKHNNVILANVSSLLIVNLATEKQKITLH